MAGAISESAGRLILDVSGRRDFRLAIIASAARRGMPGGLSDRPACSCSSPPSGRPASLLGPCKSRWSRNCFRWSSSRPGRERLAHSKPSHLTGLYVRPLPYASRRWSPPRSAERLRSGSRRASAFARDEHVRHLAATRYPGGCSCGAGARGRHPRRRKETKP